ncbi:hypothetical protein VTN00DRAFT_7191 [Thermoascus crustaceus]|uniref:uncharacterized protein n=1 Tax=Thermoascus crustaceus TaxID=5088 RepID=UPI0037423B2A
MKDQEREMRERDRSITNMSTNRRCHPNFVAFIRIIRVFISEVPYAPPAPLIVSRRAAYLILVIAVVHHRNTLIIPPSMNIDRFIDGS